jgi:hypothetical protein
VGAADFTTYQLGIDQSPRPPLDAGDTQVWAVIGEVSVVPPAT